MKKIGISFLLFLISFLSVPMPVAAASNNNLICQIFPFLSNVTSFGINSLCTGTADKSGATSFIRFLLSAVFVGIIIISIYVVIKSALKYIQSEGDDKKIGEASKAIKAVFIGIAALFVGIIGIIIVLAFFNATGALTTEDTPGIIDNLLGTPTPTSTRGDAI